MYKKFNLIVLASAILLAGCSSTPREPAAGKLANIEAIQMTAMQGESASAEVALKNVGDASLYYDSTSPEKWLRPAVNGKGILAVSETRRLLVTATCDAADTVKTGTLVLLPIGQDEVHVPVKLICTPQSEQPQSKVGKLAPVEPLQLQAIQGQIASGDLLFQNIGEAALTYSLAVGEDSPWLKILGSKEGLLAINELKKVSVQAACATTDTSKSGTITISAGGKAPVRVPVAVSCMASPPSPLPLQGKLAPIQPVQLTIVKSNSDQRGVKFTLQNIGNAPLTYLLPFEDHRWPEGQFYLKESATYNAPTGTLDVGEARTFTVMGFCNQYPAVLAGNIRAVPINQPEVLVPVVLTCAE